MRPVLAAAALLLTACGGTEADAGSPASPTSPATPTADFAYSDEGVPIEAGTYVVPRSAWSAVDFTVTFPEGWTSQYGHVYAAHTTERSEINFYAVVVDEIFTDACGGTDGIPRTVEPGTDALVRALRRQPGPQVSRPVSTTLGGRPAVRLDFRVPEGLDLSTCRLALDGVDGLQIWHSKPADKYFVLLPDSVYSAYVVDVDGRHQVFLSSYFTSTPGDQREELQEVLDSIEITS